MNLIEKIQKECNRCRDLKAQYDKIPFGAFGSYFTKLAIIDGEEAIASGNVNQMIKALKQLELCE